MKYLLVSAVCAALFGSKLRAQFNPFLQTGFTPSGFHNPLHPLGLPHINQPPKPAHAPTLHLHVPPGACHPVCSLLDLLVFNPNFSIFVTAVKVAGLVELLINPGPATVFAPTNAAFEGLPTIKFQVWKLEFIIFWCMLDPPLGFPLTRSIC
jgi:hypothetical protein